MFKFKKILFYKSPIIIIAYNIFYNTNISEL